MLRFSRLGLLLIIALIVLAAVQYELRVVAPTARKARLLYGYGSVQENQDALKRNPRDGAAHHGLAEHYLQLRNLSKAEEHFREAARIDPSDRDARFMLAITVERQKKFGEALRLYKALASENSSDQYGRAAATRARKVSSATSKPANDKKVTPSKAKNKQLRK